MIVVHGFVLDHFHDNFIIILIGPETSMICLVCVYVKVLGMDIGLRGLNKGKYEHEYTVREDDDAESHEHRVFF